MEELNSGPLKTNPASGREKDLNPGPPDYKSSVLPLGHACLLLGKTGKDWAMEGVSWGGVGWGRDWHIKRTGRLVGNFEYKP